MTPEENAAVERLLEEPCWVIDLLPRQVPAGGKGQFFRVEAYYQSEEKQTAFRRKLADVLLKLNCYESFRVYWGVDAPGETDPPPAQLEERLVLSPDRVLILTEDGNALITLDRGDLCAAVYHPSDSLLRLLGQLSAAQGLFLWQPPDPPTR